MSSLDYIIENPYIGDSYELYFREKSDLRSLVKRIEEETGLKLMAENKDDILNGFVTMIPSKVRGVFVVVSLYNVDKEPDDESPYRFKKTNLTEEVKARLYRVL